MKNCIIPSLALKWGRPGGAVFSWLLLAAAVFASGAHAQPADLSNRPLATRPVAQVKPNMMFILDGSGSMTYNFMPDTMNNTNAYGMYASQCNGLAYNPNMVYSPPVGPSGGPYANISFTAAKLDGWVGSSTLPDGTLNVAQNLTPDYYYTYNGSEPRMGWVYTQAGVVQNAFYNECMLLQSVPSSVFTKVSMATATAAEKQNYANWYSYYRKRYLLMRTAVGRAMSTLDDSFRVGFSSIIYRSAYKQWKHFKDIKDFDTAQKTDFFDDLYAGIPAGNTPLRGALAKAGRYFANKAPDQTSDPVQYSCQRNYALLTTDGYWDIASEGPIVGQWPYGPLDLTGLKTVGEQDGGEARPMKDAKATPDTLADVAEYYYRNNLRTSALNNCKSTTAPTIGQDLCKPNSVQPVQGDPATWQHMTTFTIGIGVNGVLPYDKNYLTASTGAYADLKNGIQDWPVPTGGATNVDDLWHAAVNGRGQYYMAMDSSALVDSLKGILDSLKQVAGAASAASTDSLELVPGPNNQTYKASYTTETWTGDLQAYPVNGADASVGKTPLWSAQQKLDLMPAASRKIKFLSGGVLKDFDFNNMSPAQQALFSNFCGKSSVPDQCAPPGFAFNEKDLANSGINLVNYLRGQRDYESAVAKASPGISPTVLPLYRSRAHVLGDIVNGAPRPVGKPNLGYGDAGYTAFALAQSTRQNVVYTAANDGMLHAFAADGPQGGEEMWAYVPGAAMFNLYKLADRGYAGKHQYSADGAPVITDVKIGKPAKSWKTILVAGLNAGGRGYYAVDVTDPTNPQALWEFTDSNMGLTYGNPVIGKLADGTWVVAVTSGYNNGDSVTPSGDGKGHLYILDAADGTLLMDIPTTAGTSADPSGLAKISAWVDDPADKTIMRIYGGDLKGNLWRFDLDGLLAPKKSAMLLAKFQATPGVPQPVTTPPELAVVAGKPMVIVATGRYLGLTDVSDTGRQSIYAIKDPLTDVGWGDVHADTNNFVKQTFTMNASTGKATLTDAIADMNTQGGWWVDLAQPGERVTTALKLEAGALTVATALPSSDACSLGGSSYTYFLDIANGGSLTADGFAGVMWSNNSLIAGMTWVKDISGQLKLIVQGTNGAITTETPPIPSISAVGLAHRTSWRELAD